MRLSIAQPRRKVPMHCANKNRLERLITAPRYVTTDTTTERIVLGRYDRYYHIADNHIRFYSNVGMTASYGIPNYPHLCLFPFTSRHFHTPHACDGVVMRRPSSGPGHAIVTSLQLVLGTSPCGLRFYVWNCGLLCWCNVSVSKFSKIDDKTFGFGTVRSTGFLYWCLDPTTR